MSELNAAFKKWFGKSRMVNDDGSPMIVYRGDAEEFDVFDRSKTRENGFFFTADKRIAKIYSRSNEPRAYYIRAPKVLNLAADTMAARKWVQRWSKRFDEWIDRSSGETVDPFDVLQGGQMFDYEGNWSSERWLDIQATAENQGYDAVMLPDYDNGGGVFVSVVVFDPHNVKSVDNDGTWDKDDLSVMSNPPQSDPGEAPLSDIATYTDQYSYDTSHPAYGNVNDFEWTFDPRYKLSRTDKASLWREFYAKEKKAWADEGQEDRYDDIEVAIKDGSIDPIYVVDHGKSGYVWDGNHRIGAAVTMGRTTLPAWVGRRVRPQAANPQEDLLTVISRGRVVKDVYKRSVDAEFILDPEEGQIEWREVALSISDFGLTFDPSEIRGASASEEKVRERRIRAWARDAGGWKKAIHASPILAMYVNGKLVLLDGWHRMKGARNDGVEEVTVLVGIVP